MQFKSKYISIGSEGENIDDICDYILDRIENGYDVVHVVENKYSFRRRITSTTSTDTLVSKLKRYPTQIFIHLPYSLNLCGTDRSLAWTGNVNESKKVRDTLKRIESFMMVFEDFESTLVMEAGFYKYDKDMAIQAISKSIEVLTIPMNTRLILQNSLSQYHAVVCSLLDMKQLFTTIRQSNVGISLNTLHFYGNGYYQFTDHNDIIQFFYEYDSIFASPPSLIIIGDTMSEFGNVDLRIVPIGKGHMWNNKKALSQLLYSCVSRRIPIVTPFDSDIQVLEHMVESFMK